MYLDRVDFGDTFGAILPMTNDPESLPEKNTKRSSQTDHSTEPVLLCITVDSSTCYQGCFTVDLKLGRLDSWTWHFAMTLFPHKVITQAASCLVSKLQICCFVIFSECFQSLRLTKTWTDPLFDIRNPPTNILLLNQGLSDLLDASYKFKKIHVLSSLTVILTPYSPWNKSSGVFENSVPSCPSEHQRSWMLLSWPHLISCRRLAVKLLQRHALGDSQEFDAPKAVQTYPPKI